MIRDDFIEGGFPISRTRPVLCWDNNGKLYPAYNNWTLKMIFSNTKVIKCIGIWPGKKYTDFFKLSVGHYGRLFPPKEYQNIDSANDICIKEGDEFEIIFKDPDNPDVEISSKNKELKDYIIAAGLKYKMVK